MSNILNIGIRSKQAQQILASAGGAAVENALNAAAAALERNANYILEENAKDIREASDSGMSDAMIDRLTLTQSRISSMADGLRKVAADENPVGKVIWGETRPNGLKIEKVTVPIGVIAVIFEARPNVTSDAAAICLKAGNSVILRGGKEAINSNKAVAETMRCSIGFLGLPED